MHTFRPLFVTALVVSASVGFTVSGAVQGPSAPAVAPGSQPISRTAWDGKPNFSGVWHLPAQQGRSAELGNLNLIALDGLYRPDVKALRDKLRPLDSPDYHCAPQSYPMAMSVPHPIQIVHTPGRVVILTEYLHSFRVIPTDGRAHDPGAQPSHLGESVGRWEGDTLVVDVVRFNGKQWLALAQQGPSRGQQFSWPASDAMRIVERWTLVDANTIEYQAVIDDQKMLTGPWTSARMRRTRLKYDVVQEDLCIDDVIEKEWAEKLGPQK